MPLKLSLAYNAVYFQQECKVYLFYNHIQLHVTRCPLCRIIAFCLLSFAAHIHTVDNHIVHMRMYILLRICTQLLAYITLCICVCRIFMRFLFIKVCYCRWKFCGVLYFCCAYVHSCSTYHIVHMRMQEIPFGFRLKNCVLLLEIL